MTTDGSTLETNVQSCSDFLESFAQKLKHPASSLFHNMTAVIFVQGTEAET
jgi:hypothetical protein